MRAAAAGVDGSAAPLQHSLVPPVEAAAPPPPHARMPLPGRICSSASVTTASASPTGGSPPHGHHPPPARGHVPPAPQDSLSRRNLLILKQMRERQAAAANSEAVVAHSPSRPKAAPGPHRNRQSHHATQHGSDAPVRESPSVEARRGAPATRASTVGLVVAAGASSRDAATAARVAPACQRPATSASSTPPSAPVIVVPVPQATATAPGSNDPTSMQRRPSPTRPVTASAWASVVLRAATIGRSRSRSRSPAGRPSTAGPPAASMSAPRLPPAAPPSGAAAAVLATNMRAGRTTAAAAIARAATARAVGMVTTTTIAGSELDVGADGVAPSGLSPPARSAAAVALAQAIAATKAGGCLSDSEALSVRSGASSSAPGSPPAVTLALAALGGGAPTQQPPLPAALLSPARAGGPVGGGFLYPSTDDSTSLSGFSANGERGGGLGSMLVAPGNPATTSAPAPGPVHTTTTAASPAESVPAAAPAAAAALRTPPPSPSQRSDSAVQVARTSSWRRLLWHGSSRSPERRAAPPAPAATTSAKAVASPTSEAEVPLPTRVQTSGPTPVPLDLTDSHSCSEPTPASLAPPTVPAASSSLVAVTGETSTRPEVPSGVDMSATSGASVAPQQQATPARASDDAPAADAQAPERRDAGAPDLTAFGGDNVAHMDFATQFEAALVAGAVVQKVPFGGGRPALRRLALDMQTRTIRWGAVRAARPPTAIPCIPYDPQSQNVGGGRRRTTSRTRTRGVNLIPLCSAHAISLPCQLSHAVFPILSAPSQRTAKTLSSDLPLASIRTVLFGPSSEVFRGSVLPRGAALFWREGS